MYGCEIFVNIKDSVFESNGDIKIATSWSSILWLNSYSDDINMEIKNEILKKNSFFENGMIFVHNEHGTTNISLVKVLLSENGYYNLRIPKNLLFFEGYNMAVRIEFCRVISSACRLLQLAGQTVQMNVFNILK